MKIKKENPRLFPLLALFVLLAATLLMTAGGMACHTYNQVFALSGPPVIANLNISRNSQQV